MSRATDAVSDIVRFVEAHHGQPLDAADFLDFQDLLAALAVPVQAGEVGRPGFRPAPGDDQYSKWGLLGVPHKTDAFQVHTLFALPSWREAMKLLLRQISQRGYSCLDRFPATPAGHVAFIEFVRDEVRLAVESKQQQLERGYSNETLEKTIRGILWTEAAFRAAQLSELLPSATAQVAAVLRRELTLGTVEQVDARLRPVVAALRDAWEDHRTDDAPVSLRDELLLLLWNAEDRDAGIAVVDLPKRLRDETLLSACHADGLIRFAARNAVWHGKKLVIEPGWNVADLTQPKRKLVYQLVREALTQEVDDAIRIRVQFVNRGAGEAAKLALAAGAAKVNVQPEQPPTVGVIVEGDQISRRLLSVFTNGLSDDRLVQAESALRDANLNANEKLWKISEVLPIPTTVSADQLGKLLGVTKQAVMKTDWWEEKRKGEKASEIGRRLTKHQDRATGYQSNRSEGE